MSKHAWDEKDTTGYFLPEDSRFRLKKLYEYMVFLSQLAQPRRHDEDQERMPDIRVGELAVCLELLAEQVGRVLDETTWPAEREVGRDRSRARDEADVPEAPTKAAEADTAVIAEDAEDRWVFGMTMDQLDTLNRLHDRLYAHGDLIFSAGRLDLADGTLTVIGDVIFEAVGAVRDLMDKVAEQHLPLVPKPPPVVREARAIYGSSAGPGLASGAAVPVLQLPADAGWRPGAVTRH